MTKHVYHREHFTKLDQLNKDLLHTVLNNSETQDLIGGWDWDIYTHQMRIKELQYIAKTNTKDSDLQTKHDVLHMHLQAITDAIAHTAYENAHAHAWAVQFRYERIAEMISLVCTNAAHRAFDLVDRQTAFIFQYYEPYIIKIARKYLSNISYQDYAFDDLSQNAAVGLLKAIRNFSIDRDAEFMTHAFNHIRCENSRDKAKKHEINISHGDILKLNQLHHFMEGYYARHSELPSTAYIAKHLNWSIEKIEELLKFPKLRKTLDEHGMADEPILSHEMDEGDLNINIYMPHVWKLIKDLSDKERRALLDSFELDTAVDVSDMNYEQRKYYKQRALLHLRKGLSKNKRYLEEGDL